MGTQRSHLRPPVRGGIQPGRGEQLVGRILSVPSSPGPISAGQLAAASLEFGHYFGAIFRAKTPAWNEEPWACSGGRRAAIGKSFPTT